MHWLTELWNDIRGNFEFWLLLVTGSGLVTASAAVTRRLKWRERSILLLLFVALFGWCAIASYLATRPPRIEAAAPTKEVINEQNIERKVREWLGAFNLGAVPISDEHAYFNFALFAPTRIPPIRVG